MNNRLSKLCIAIVFYKLSGMNERQITPLIEAENVTNDEKNFIMQTSEKILSFLNLIKLEAPQK